MESNKVYAWVSAIVIAIIIALLIYSSSIAQTIIIYTKSGDTIYYRSKRPQIAIRDIKKISAFGVKELSKDILKINF